MSNSDIHHTGKRHIRTSVNIKMKFSTLHPIYSESYIHHENFKPLFYVLVLVYFVAHTYCVQEFVSFGLQTQTPWCSCSLYMYQHPVFCLQTHTHTHSKHTLLLSLETPKPSA